MENPNTTTSGPPTWQTRSIRNTSTVMVSEVVVEQKLWLEEAKEKSERLQVMDSLKKCWAQFQED